jgi:aspartate/methionine/tyrosine aminotransferase
MDYQPLITDRLRRIDASGIRKVFELAAKIDNPVNLSIGQPDFDVPEPIKEAAIQAIRTGPNAYSLTQGRAEMVDAARGQIDPQFARDGRWSDYGCMITCGVSGGLVLAVQTCVEPGDEVLVPDPYFVMYKHLVTMAGGTCRFVDTYPDFQMTAQRIEPLITERTKMLMISSPSNPTGVVTSEAQFKELVELCEKHNILLVSDEIYDAFCYEKVDSPTGPRAPSPAAFSDQVLILRGFSKTFGMTGWRLGYAAGPKPIIEQMIKLQQYTFVCAPTMVQAAGLVAVDYDMSDYIAAYQAKRDMVCRILDGHFELVKPGGAFYAFPRAPEGQTAMEFVEKAIARDVLIIPGSVFSEQDTHFRISYATDDQTLQRGLETLVELADN